ncbi:MAG TPA: tRNA (adenosine(37)-N6)-dimethylallyltransferase MiaA, partial [Polyangiaceae bacterium]|nr:tRNA (adenosine(37)-N6)-dimethylallyltransferase MiaA [Polyangiaceae bacterium]
LERARAQSGTPVSPPWLAIVGPTASGKSDLAQRICERIGGEVVSADSVQIYRRFDIGSAKPGAAERARIPHHLIDELDPLDAADAARFVELADARITQIVSRGQKPVICGGTFLWVRALAAGLVPAPPADPQIRARHRREAAERGRAHLHAQLAKIDPASHARLAPNDLVRVSRALEVFELTGKALSELHAEHGFRSQRHALQLIGIEHPREELKRRIHERVVGMFERGWLDEVRALIADGYGEARALRAVGYRQVADALRSGAPLDLPSLIESVARATRIFVRRQLTWLREEPVRWLRPEQLDAFCQQLSQPTTESLARV